MSRKPAILGVLGCLFLVTGAYGQQAVDPVPCINSASGHSNATNPAAYKRFELEMRNALTTEDVKSVAFLVEFPLHVTTPKGSITIDDETSLQGHFEEVFPLALRQKVLATEAGDFFCHEDRIGYADGMLWIDLTKAGYKISTVNAETTPVSPLHTPALMFACQTKTHRITIERQSAKGLHYQSWNIPKSLTAPPDLELSNGKERWEGTGVCASHYFTFTNRNVVIEVEGALGCTDGSEPANARGRLSVTIDGKQVTDAWCF